MQISFYVPKMSEETKYTYTKGVIYWLCGHEMKSRKVKPTTFDQKIASGEWVILPTTG
ncbi:hypothetical protein [Thaumasiovibrio sp. DFM-14]|uniref:hypothetical protein n=1 Tax=Thaumasiovibrio sp. DFM-14 TaxID=3384792 RepID=UPI0039A3DF83